MAQAFVWDVRKSVRILLFADLKELFRDVRSEA